MDHLKTTMRRKIFLNFISQHLNESYRDTYDVTLVSDDCTQFQAHKVVLGAASPLLRKILLDNPHHHPLVYLQGIHHQELGSILHFIYKGQAKFPRNRLSKILKNIKELQIKQKDTRVKAVGLNYELQKELKQTGDEGEQQYQNSMSIDENSVNNSVDKFYDIEFDSDSGDHYNRELMYNNGGNSERDYINMPSDKLYTCNSCSKRYTSKAGLKNHFKIQHEGYRYPCNECNYQATDPGVMKRHTEALHEQISYPCDYCDYSASRKDTLRIHQIAKHIDKSKKQSDKSKKHTDVKYYCDQCDYKGKKLSSFKNHKKAMHGNTRHICNVCHYEASRGSILKRHKQSTHEGLMYPCDECNHSFTRMEHLRRHQQTKHKDMDL